MSATAAAPSFTIWSTKNRPVNKVPWSETYHGSWNAGGQDPTWTVTRVDDHPQQGSFVHLSAGPDARHITDPLVMLSLARVLITQARLLGIEEPTYSRTVANDETADTLLGALEDLEDSWDLVGGVVAAHRIFADRLRDISRDLLRALGGDENLTDTWQLDDMAGPQRDVDVADAIHIVPARLHETLRHWAAFEPDPGHPTREPQL